MRGPPLEWACFADLTAMRKVLNVGGNNKAIPLPPEYEGWEHVLLDIDPRGNPDIVADARTLTELPAAQYDAVYCSNNLEHYYRHDCIKVLAGFRHVLKDDGFAHILVPDIGVLFQLIAHHKLDIDDFLYDSPSGRVLVRDVIYGFGPEIEHSGQDFYAHKTGFSQKSLPALLRDCGFTHVFTASVNLEIRSFAFKAKPSEFARKLFGLPEGAPA